MIVAGVLGGLFIYVGCLKLGMTHGQAIGVVLAYTGMRIWRSADK